MDIEKIISRVKSNYGYYESISLANDDVEWLLIVIHHMQKQKKSEREENDTKRS